MVKLMQTVARRFSGLTPHQKHGLKILTVCLGVYVLGLSLRFAMHMPLLFELPMPIWGKP